MEIKHGLDTEQQEMHTQFMERSFNKDPLRRRRRSENKLNDVKKEDNDLHRTLILKYGTVKDRKQMSYP
jgi:hypothetical protein